MTSSNNSTIPTPELDKIKAVKEESQKIGDFLEWCRSQDMELGQWGEDGAGDFRLMKLAVDIEQVVADYFGIDLKKVEVERRQILEALQKKQNE